MMEQDILESATPVINSSNQVITNSSSSCDEIGRHAVVTPKPLDYRSDEKRKSSTDEDSVSQTIMEKEIETCDIYNSIHASKETNKLMPAQNLNLVNSISDLDSNMPSLSNGNQSSINNNHLLTEIPISTAMEHRSGDSGGESHFISSNTDRPVFSSQILQPDLSIPSCSRVQSYQSQDQHLSIPIESSSHQDDKRPNTPIECPLPPGESSHPSYQLSGNFIHERTNPIMQENSTVDHGKYVQWPTYNYRNFQESNSSIGMDSKCRTNENNIYQNHNSSYWNGGRNTWNREDRNEWSSSDMWNRYHYPHQNDRINDRGGRHGNYNNQYYSSYNKYNSNYNYYNNEKHRSGSKKNSYKDYYNDKHEYRHRGSYNPYFYQNRNDSSVYGKQNHAPNEFAEDEDLSAISTFNHKKKFTSSKRFSNRRPQSAEPVLEQSPERVSSSTSKPKVDAVPKDHNSRAIQAAANRLRNLTGARHASESQAVADSCGAQDLSIPKLKKSCLESKNTNAVKKKTLNSAVGSNNRKHHRNIKKKDKEANEMRKHLLDSLNSDCSDSDKDDRDPSSDSCNSKAVHHKSTGKSKIAVECAEKENVNSNNVTGKEAPSQEANPKVDKILVKQILGMDKKNLQV